MVDLTMTPVPTQGATPLVLRCMNQYNWSADKARSVLAEYKQFLQHPTTKRSDGNHGSLNDDVDKMWRMHILDTRNYAADCMQLCNGTVVHYNPDGAKNPGSSKARTTKRGRGKQCKQPGSASDASSDVGIYGPQKDAKAPPAAAEAAAAPLNPSHSMENEEGEIENVRPITIQSHDETDQDTFFKLEEQQPNGTLGVGRWGHN